eukprot:TRINITY_DN713_c0_g1_i1.p1 TRINITY_DN713_c0_g1~~TRINITY_DN713_c0_g1_i1.p1  ORF type:complete len:153 (-),score=2.84 TRINITY_DN713_c0_g1_i1:1000-1458(-)
MGYRSPSYSPRGRYRSPSYSPRRRYRSPSYSPHGRYRSPCYSPHGHYRSPCYSPHGRYRSPCYSSRKRYRSPSYSPPRRAYYRRSPSPGPRSRYGGRSRYSSAPTSLLVRNLRRDCMSDDLRGPFREFGPIKDIYLPRDYYTGLNEDNEAKK